MISYPFLPLLSITFLLFRGGTFLNFFFISLLTLIISPEFADPDYFSYEDWYNVDLGLFDRLSPGFNLLINLSKSINLEYNDFRLLLFLIFLSCISLIFHLLNKENFFSNRIIDIKTILFINSFPFILLSNSILRQGLATFGVTLFIILLSRNNFLTNKIYKYILYSLSIFLSVFHLYGLITLFFIYLYLLVKRLSEKNISFYLMRLLKFKITKKYLKELLLIFVFSPLFIIYIFFQGLAERFNTRMFTSDNLLDKDSIILILLLLIPLIILLRNITYLDMKFRILLYLNISTILSFFVSTMAGGRIALSTIFYNLIFFLYSNYRFRVNNFDFGKFYLILVFLATLFKVNYFYFLRFYF